MPGTQNKCPVCGHDSLKPGETVDIGVGCIKAGPDTCPICGFIEAGPDPHDLPIEHYRRCWELRIDPHPKHPQMKRGPLKKAYREWIARNVEGTGYGCSEEWSRKMAAAFPELRQVHGRYYCLTWGERSHFWCVDPENNIVDPTRQQFPSQGLGIYSIKYFCDEEAATRRTVVAEAV